MVLQDKNFTVLTIPMIHVAMKSYLDDKRYPDMYFLNDNSNETWHLNSILEGDEGQSKNIHE